MRTSGGRADLQMEVAASELDGLCEEVNHVHGPEVGFLRSPISEEPGAALARRDRAGDQAGAGRRPTPRRPLDCASCSRGSSRVAKGDRL